LKQSDADRSAALSGCFNQHSGRDKDFYWFQPRVKPVKIFVRPLKRGVR